MARRTFLRSAGLTAFAAAAITSSALLAGCGDDTSASTQADSVAVSEQWVKAADSGMTAAFGVIANDTDSDIRIVSGDTEASTTTELHEVVESGGTMTMREKKDGFVIPAKGSLTLKPGAEHIMLMGVKKPIRSGDSVTVTLRFEDGSTKRIDALARDFDGNQENYVPAAGHPGTHQ